MKKLLLAALTLLATPAMAQTALPSAWQKSIFIPDSLKPYNLNDDTSRWCWRHSSQTQNLVFFWENGFGDDTSNPPQLDGHPMHFDIGNLQTQVERFYRFFRDTLKFSLPGSKCDQYKMMVMVDYSLEGTAYGGTYDDFIGALWVAPNRIQDRKLNCLAHELGHSFQLQIMADSVGEAWGGSGFFEMTSQWMLWQVNPDWLTDENYHFEAFKKLTHKGFLHLENIYHSPFVIEWWSEKHGLPSIAELYREGRVGEDPAVTYMRKYGLTQSQFCDEMYDCYAHLLNFDFSHARKESRPYACTFDTPMQPGKGGWMRPDTARVPENYGFNAIKLDGIVSKISENSENSEVTKKNKKPITVSFRGLSKDRTAGYRYGIVAVTADGQTLYSPIQTARKGRITYTPSTDKQLKTVYLLVMGAPTTHSLDPSSRRFPYEIKW